MLQHLFELLLQFIHIILHLDLYLNGWIQAFGPGIYAILFLIIFCETGLVVTPFLPGDSLLFALGAMTVVENAYLSFPLLWILLIIAASLGDALNYSVGRFVGARLFTNPNSKIFRRDYLEKTEAFYKKHGGKTVILGRYMPIVRTFAPFVTGMAKMNYPKFLSFMLIGNLSWISLFLVAGRFFGNQPYVKNNFHVVIFAIIVISFLPVALEVVKAKRTKATA
jgi:membrane-associated protein